MGPVTQPGINLAAAFAALADDDGDQQCLIFGERTMTRAVVRARAAGIAGLLAAAGLGCFAERDRLAGWERGQSTVGLMLFNGNEYLEAMLGSYAARCAPANFNWRSTAEELAYLLADSGAEALIYHRSLRSTVARTLELAKPLKVLLEVDDGTTEQGDIDAPPGSAPYEEAVARAESTWIDGSPDDLYVLYTGGTTGRPKGTLWCQRDFVAGALGVRHTNIEFLVAAAAKAAGRLRSLAAPPLIHGAAQWNAWSAWLGGGTVVFPSSVHRFDPLDVLETAERERVTSLQIVGDAFGRPLLDTVARRSFDLPALRFITSGGTALSPETRIGLQQAFPGVIVLDIMGSSEAGRLAVATHGSIESAPLEARAEAPAGFVPSDSSTVIDEDRRALVAVSNDEIGWLAKPGPIPLGYLGDRAKTETTFPTIDGVRYAVPGDRARWRADGSIEVLGRDASVINTGGEKVFAEEVEAALVSHPAVADALVIGRPHPVLGNEICAVVAFVDDPASGRGIVTIGELRDHVSTTLARYKLPRHFSIVPTVRRSPAGKPDYAWARAEVAPGTTAPDPRPSPS